MYINVYVDSFIPCSLTSLTSNFTQYRPLSNETERVSTLNQECPLSAGPFSLTPSENVHFYNRPPTLNLTLAIKIGETITETIKECLKSLKSMLLFIMLSMDSLPLLEWKVLCRKMRTNVVPMLDLKSSKRSIDFIWRIIEIRYSKIQISIFKDFYLKSPIGGTIISVSNQHYQN